MNFVQLFPVWISTCVWFPLEIKTHLPFRNLTSSEVSQNDNTNAGLWIQVGNRQMPSWLPTYPHVRTAKNCWPKIRPKMTSIQLWRIFCDANKGENRKTNEETFNRLNNYDEEILYPNIFVISIEIIMKKCHIEAGEKPKLADLLPTCCLFWSASSCRPDFSLLQRPANAT